jgi:hypothetical protein
MSGDAISEIGRLVQSVCLGAKRLTANTNVGSSGIESRFPAPESHPISRAEVRAFKRAKQKAFLVFQKLIV